MRILVIGSKGNMGRRYIAILKYLGVEAIEFEVNDRIWDCPSFDRAIIATPTDQHGAMCLAMAIEKRPFLCEKPISKDPDEIVRIMDLCEKNGVDGRMVCNWAFAHRMQSYLEPNSCDIQYNNYNTGKDGLAWDCIQLIYLAKGMPDLKTDAPNLDCTVDGYFIDEAMIAESYIKMIVRWLEDPTKLWSLEDAKKATEKVIAYEAMVASRLLP